jgi:hypothetical protein
MRPRTTLLLLAFVIGLASFIYYYERHQLGTIESRKAGSLTSLEVSEIDSMELQNASGTIKFKKKLDGLWYLTDPIDDRLDQTLAQRLIDMASKAEIAQTVPAKEVTPEDLKSYGLDEKEAITLAWRTNGKTVGKLKLGKIGALGDTVYAEAPGHKIHNDIYLIFARPEANSSNFRDEVNRALADMRDKKLLPFSTAKIASVSIRRPVTGGEIQIQRKLISETEATPWAITKPLKSRADDKSVNDRLGYLASSQVKSLFAPGTPPKDVPETPAVELQVQSDLESKGVTIRLYDTADAAAESGIGYFVDRKTWFTYPLDVGEPDVTKKGDLLHVFLSPLETLRTHTLADLDAKKLSTILIQQQYLPPISLYRIGSHWIMKNGEKGFGKASGDRVAKTIKAVNEAEIGRFVTDSLTDPAEYGLDHPWQTITFASALHTPKGLGPVTPENSITLLLGKAADEKLYANFKGESSVFLMLPEHYGLIPSQPLKWKEPQILSFAPFSVRKYVQTLGNEPPTTLVSPPQSSTFSASRGGGDVTPLLDKETVQRTLARLSSLNVSDWTAELKEAVALLQTPELEIEMDIDFVEDSNGFEAPKTQNVKLAFAPAGKVGTTGKSPFYLGSCTDVPDYFYITRETFKELSTPLLKAVKED